MISGIGTDLIAIERIARVWQRHGERLCAHILSPEERIEFTGVHDPARWLAKRWAAKEAFAKAAGTGMRGPLKWAAITIVHDALGRPGIALAPFLQAWLHRRGIDASHLSISDERDMACAVVVLECKETRNVVA
ncbi:MAG: holo-ACP synthase [Betaproteobacteria bacterium]